MKNSRHLFNVVKRLCHVCGQMLPAAGLTQQSAADGAVVPQITSQMNQLQLNQPSVRINDYWRKCIHRIYCIFPFPVYCCGRSVDGEKE